MILISESQRRRAFSIWLRTGRLPRVAFADGIELKFNPWHDPADGRFTFAGSGQNYGRDRTSPIRRAGDHRAPIGNRSEPQKPISGAGPKVGPSPSGRLGSTAAPPKPQQTQPGAQRNSAVEFVSGVGEGLYHVGKETAAGAYSLFTTNSVTTVSNTAIGIAETIDSVLVAENTPARIHIARAVDTIAHASSRDLGRATGSIVGNVALAAAPGATLSKVSALRRMRAVTPRISYDPPQIGWVKENLTSDKPWKLYNDQATGARSGQAPTLTRTLPNGSRRPVKFDGVHGEYVVDRKWAIRDQPRARAQVLRQSEVLSQHRLIGVWEVPNEHERLAAIKLLKKLNVTNIKIRIVKP